MDRHHDEARVLAIELRARRFGYAVLSGPNRLLDWGAKKCPKEPPPVAQSMIKKILPLVSLFAPTTVVLKNMGGARRNEMKPVVMAIQRELLKRSIEVILLKRSDVRQAFRPVGCRNKYAIASNIAVMFPELKWTVPKKRKAWQPEPHHAACFDAVSLALAHWSQCGVPVERRIVRES